MLVCIVYYIYIHIISRNVYIYTHMCVRLPCLESSEEKLQGQAKTHVEPLCCGCLEALSGLSSPGLHDLWNGGTREAVWHAFIVTHPFWMLPPSPLPSPFLWDGFVGSTLATRTMRRANVEMAGLTMQIPLHFAKSTLQFALPLSFPQVCVRPRKRTHTFTVRCGRSIWVHPE